MSKKRRSQKSVTSFWLAVIILIGGYFYTGNSNRSLTSFFNGQPKTTQTAKQAPTKQESQLAKLEFKSGGQPYVTINNNRATLNPSDWRTNHVIYQNLDGLNRTSAANIGYLENRNLASGSLRVRQYVNPTAWHQKMVDRSPIINRGHLIAYSFSKGINSAGKYDPRDQSGDQNNPKNLFTQTAFSNQRVQTIFESKVRNALYNHKRVIFYARPIFRGQELMARGVHLQAISTDKQLNFNVYLFNVQPKVSFDYRTGRSTINRQMQVANPSPM